MPNIVETDGRWLSLQEIIREIKNYQDPLDPTKPPKVAISISGGGATCAYQGGALKAFFDSIKDCPELRPKIIVATSGGALNAFALLLEQFGLVSTTEEPMISRLWKIIGHRNAGARFVVTNKNRWLLELLTRWKTWGLDIIADFVKAFDSLFKKVLFGGLALLLLGALFVVVPRTAIVLLIALSMLLVFAVLFAGDKSLFDNQHLHNTLVNALLATEINEQSLLNEKLSPQDEKQAAEKLIGRWQEMLGQDSSIDLIMTSTDISYRGEALFTLASPAVYKNLAHSNWQVYQIARESDFEAYRVEPELAYRCGRVAPEKFFDCLLSSTSIPAAFPTRLIPLYSNRGDDVVVHQFVDGGVLNNSPLHVAIDAGATHVISFELNPLAESDPLDKESCFSTAQLNLIQNVAETFSTVVGLSTTEDIRRAASWNRWIRKHPDSKHDKQIVGIYRLGPLKEECGFGIIDFNGHYDIPFEPTITVMDWFNTGFRDANLPRYWDATFSSAPQHQPDSPKKLDVLQEV